MYLLLFCYKREKFLYTGYPVPLEIRYLCDKNAASFKNQSFPLIWFDG
jgi:hypothetical protein